MNLVHFRTGVEKNKLQYVASVGSRQQQAAKVPLTT